MIRALHAHDRLRRITALFTFVSQLHADGSAADLRDGVDLLARLAGPGVAPAVLLTALLKAAGERAQVDYARDLVYVRVEIDAGEVSRLPPHAALLVARRRGRCYLPLWVRHARSAVGFLPLAAREGLARRRFIA